MAIKYWALTGNDTTGDGSATNPYKTLAKAVTEAGAFGEARHIGVTRRTLANPATWTNGSAVVTVPGDETAQVAADDFVRVDSDGSGRTTPWYRVAAVDFAGGVTTITLARTYRGQTVTSTTWAVTPEDWSASPPVYTGANNVTCTFGWDTSETQPANVMSAISMADGSGYALSRSDNLGTIVADGRLLLCRAARGLSSILRVVGSLDVSECAIGVYTSGGGNISDNDEIVSSYNATTGVYVTYYRARSIVLHNQANALKPERFDCRIDRAYVHSATSRVTVVGTGWIGELETANCGAANIIEGPDDYLGAPGLIIGRFTSDAPPILSKTAAIVSPPAQFAWPVFGGKVDLATGRGGGSDLCLRMDPAPTWGGNTYPLQYPMSFWAKSGANLTVTFWAKYSGTQVPEFFVVLNNPNGLTTKKVNITLTTSWEQYSVQFDGTTATDGIVTLAFCVLDNQAADALVFVDDVSVRGAGAVPRTGNGSWHGFMGDFLVDSGGLMRAYGYGLE